MKKLLILSGKGGTGKTTTAASFIKFSESKAIADCDVDAPNLHIVMTMNVEPEKKDFIGSEKARIDSEKCIGCNKCAEYCRFRAVKNLDGVYSIDEYSCEGCGVCEAVCPADAVTMQEDVAGHLSLYRDERIFSTAKLKMGRGNSGKLVTAVKKQMIKSAGSMKENDIAIIDGSPGIGCPVIASINGVDLVLIVTEPSISGLNDLKRLIETTSVLQSKAAVCINRWDLCPEQSAEIEKYCEENRIPFTGKIPYDRMASKAINMGMSVADIDCIARDALLEVYENTLKEL